MGLTAGQWLQIVAAVLTFALTAIVLRVSRRPGASRALRVLLVVEGLAQLSWAAQRGAQYSASS